MESINYRKILEKLMEEYPHELDKIEEVVNKAMKEGQDNLYIDLGEIIKSDVWNSDEKVRLLTLFGYNNECNVNFIDIKNDYAYTSMKDYLYTIKHNNLSGFEALMEIYKNLEDNKYRDEVYRNSFKEINKITDDENRISYFDAILDNLTSDDIKRLIKPRYSGQYISGINNESIFSSIIASKRLDLIKKYIVYIDDINMYFSEAVATGDIEIVKFFLERGADINYLTIV